MMTQCFKEKPPYGGLADMIKTGCIAAAIPHDDIEVKIQPLLQGLNLVTNFVQTFVDRVGRFCACSSE